MNQEDRDFLNAGVFKARLVFAALFASQAIYAWIAPRLGETSASLSEAFANVTGTVLFAYGIGCLIASFFLPKFLLNATVKREMASGSKSLRPVLNTVFVAFIVQVALRESIGALGLAAITMTKSLPFFHLMLAISTGSLLLSWPSEDRWEREIQQAQGK